MRWSLLILVIWTLLATRCGAAKEDARVAEVAAATPCPLQRCLPPTEAQAALKFRPLEPSSLPEGWQLYSRAVESFELPQPARELEARIRGVPISEVSRTSKPTLRLEYRFQNSDFVTGITIREDLPDQPVRALKPETPGCADVISIRGMPALYGVGSGRSHEGPTPGTWFGCAETGPQDRDAHVVMLVQGAVLVQLRAFPEAKLTKDDVLKIAASLRPAP